MKLTKKSQLLMSYFLDNRYIQSKKKNPMLESLFQDLLNAYDYLHTIKNKVNVDFYKITVKQITSIYHIPRPSNFNAHSFPYTIRKHIDETMLTEICYTFSLFGRNITLYFIVEELESQIHISTYNKYVETVVLWLYILNEYASKKCSLYFTVYFYFTSLEKRLPGANIEVLNENHVNTAFTSTCPRNSEIILFRKEEWFKVFMHETFHNFALDFSDMNTYMCNQHILSIFPVKSEVNLYEAYTEFWAELMNCCFCSFFKMRNKEDFTEFQYYFDYYIGLERKYSFFQMVKTLDFMGLCYKDLYSNHAQSSIMRSNLYKERTNVLSYYIIKTILLQHYPLFLEWCNKNNLSLMQFKKTHSNLESFCNFISKFYKSRSMLQEVKEMEDFWFQLKTMKTIKKKYNNPKMIYLLNNMRMSICELG
jgi:hypothetical protein